VEAKEASIKCKAEQEKLEVDLQAKAKYSRVHKAATKLYASELEKGEKGMASRKVEAVQRSWSKPCNNSPLYGEEWQG